MTLTSVSRRVWTTGILLLLFVGLPRSASANVMLPATFAFHLPWWVSSLTFGLLFVVIGVAEGLLLTYLLRIEWKRALLFSFAANGVSTLVGAGLAASSVGSAGGLICCLALLFLLVFVPAELHRRWGWSLGGAWGVALLPVVVLFLLALSVVSNISLTRWIIYGPLLLAFALTVLVESLVIRRWHDSGPLVKRVALANLATYAFLVAVLIVVQVGPIDNPRLGNYTIEVIAISEAENGNTERALALLEQVRDRHTGPRVSWWFRRVKQETHTYHPRGEIKVAKILIARKEYAAARRLIADTLQLDLWETEYTKCRQDLTELLAQIPEDSATTTIASSSPEAIAQQETTGAASRSRR